MVEKKKAAKEPKEGVSVRCSPEMRRRAKVYAARNNRTILAIVDEALAEYLKTKGAGA